MFQIKHEGSPIPIVEAVKKPEFWAVTAITTSRTVAGICSCILSVIPEYSTLGGILALYSMGMDLVDGNYAREHHVETRFGQVLDNKTDIISLAAVIIFIAAKFA